MHLCVERNSTETSIFRYVAATVTGTGSPGEPLVHTCVHSLWTMLLGDAGPNEEAGTDAHGRTVRHQRRSVAGEEPVPAR